MRQLREDGEPIPMFGDIVYDSYGTAICRSCIGGPPPTESNMKIYCTILEPKNITLPKDAFYLGKNRVVFAVRLYWPSLKAASPLEHYVVSYDEGDRWGKRDWFLGKKQWRLGWLLIGDSALGIQ